MVRIPLGNAPDILYIDYTVIFAWNRWNTEHIARHGVLPGEAEYVVENAEPPFPRPEGDDELKAWGQTEAGRYLQVVFIYVDAEDVDFDSLDAAGLLDFADEDRDVVDVIHAMERTDGMKRQYRRRRK